MKNIIKYALIIGLILTSMLIASAATKTITINKDVQISTEADKTMATKTADPAAYIADRGVETVEKEAIQVLKREFVLKEKLCEANADTMKACIAALDTVVNIKP